MEAFFYVIPSIVIAVVVLGAVKVVGRSRQMHRAWNSGVTAEAKCLQAYTTTSGGGGDTSVTTTLHHIYEFTTREGRLVRFEEEDGPAMTVIGDIVTVHYEPEHPERATARPPARGKLLAGTGFLLVFLGVLAAFAVAFMIGAHSAFSAGDDFAP
ncbi:DUF3592 domain-containing protein [Streptomyces mangrovisoli]|uniref:DUF3592 domain-containing protein n=1 Tax=Streptomyces mangrovisoli TaxID=1428628 RepID=A0A1J4NK73_9ACTN|nr:DUF3592 domain-containing protein [Streptomyces mangrovisoli]OIJ62699.1 hypothetical protein WN71_038110 [Streptomyces mangrovisoli]